MMSFESTAHFFFRPPICWFLPKNIFSIKWGFFLSVKYRQHWRYSCYFDRHRTTNIANIGEMLRNFRPNLKFWISEFVEKCYQDMTYAHSTFPLFWDTGRFAKIPGFAKLSFSHISPISAIFLRFFHEFSRKLAKFFADISDIFWYDIFFNIFFDPKNKEIRGWFKSNHN